MTQPVDFRPRPAQKAILNYRGGRLGVSAVPGAGKTHILAVLAAALIKEGIGDDQEILVVTLVNSAVENIKSRIAQFVQRQGLVQSLGYRVRTLHGLAHDIVRDRPDLVGLSNDFDIVDERAAQQICQNTTEMWLQSHPDIASALLNPELSDKRREWVLGSLWPEAANSLALAFIKRAKDLRQTPTMLMGRLEAANQEPSSGQARLLARMGIEIYADYQTALYHRGSVDFDDLIRLADQALEQNSDLLDRLRHQWPYVLEDEAQDSSALQESILSKLVGPLGNWVRVGDPNQAINTTFTTADPKFLRDFLRSPGVTARPLGSSGRSQQGIIDLANQLVRWVMHDHPDEKVRRALSAPPYIEPTPPGDPQPNPPHRPSDIHLVERRYSPDGELNAISRSLARWLPKHRDDTVAILVPRNQRGFQVADALRKAGLKCEELLRSSSSTRKTAGALGNVLNYLATPHSAPLLARAFEVWRREDRDQQETALRLKRLSGLISQCRHIEDYLWPRPDHDWLRQFQESLAPTIEPDESEDSKGSHGLGLDSTLDLVLLNKFRVIARRWQNATRLPIDQLLLTIGQDLFLEPHELALTHKLALVLRAASDKNPHWRLAELTEELSTIARNQRRFLGFDPTDAGFEPKPGIVTVSTLHKAKGLEWDRVYLISVNNYSFPYAQPYDTYIGEKWFIRDQLNLEAEVLEQLHTLLNGKRFTSGSATHQARLDYVAERLRLLYVGITRARKELVITWNTGRSKEAKQMAIPFVALAAWWQEYQSR